MIHKKIDDNKLSLNMQTKITIEDIDDFSINNSVLKIKVNNQYLLDFIEFFEINKNKN
jgi:hypothetical protein